MPLLLCVFGLLADLCEVICLGFLWFASTNKEKTHKRQWVGEIAFLVGCVWVWLFQSFFYQVFHCFSLQPLIYVCSCNISPQIPRAVPSARASFASAASRAREGQMRRSKSLLHPATRKRTTETNDTRYSCNEETHTIKVDFDSHEVIPYLKRRFLFLPNMNMYACITRENIVGGIHFFEKLL